MNMSTIADWCTILFFLWFGLKTFILPLIKAFSQPWGELVLSRQGLPQSSTGVHELMMRYKSPLSEAGFIGPTFLQPLLKEDSPNIGRNLI